MPNDLLAPDLPLTPPLISSQPQSHGDPSEEALCDAGRSNPGRSISHRESLFTSIPPQVPDDGDVADSHR